jgi:integrase
MGKKVKGTDLVFCKLDGTAWSSYQVDRRFKRVQKKFAIEIKNRLGQNKLAVVGDNRWSLHLLRHTWITLMINSGKVSDGLVSKWAGHSSVETTLNRYAHIVEGSGKKASGEFYKTLEDSVLGIKVK